MTWEVLSKIISHLPSYPGGHVQIARCEVDRHKALIPHCSTRQAKVHVPRMHLSESEQSTSN